MHPFRRLLHLIDALGQGWVNFAGWLERKGLAHVFLWAVVLAFMAASFLLLPTWHERLRP
jgi:hypothetical protein